MRDYIKYKTYYDRKPNDSKLEERGYVYVLQRTADHQGIRILFAYFRWIGPHITEKLNQIITTCYARLQGIKRKSFIACQKDR